MIYEDLEVFVKNIQVNNALIGLDLGTKTIGVAVSDKTLSVATPIKTIKRKKFSLDANCLLEIITDKLCSGIIFGLPKNTVSYTHLRAHETN